jgi:hypothetical protein
MVASATPGQVYWSLIEPHWLDLNRSWDFGEAEFLAALSHVPVRTQRLYCAHWCQSEVCNGGLHQFFSNSTGLLAPEAVIGFAKIGSREWADIVSEAARFFGDPYPRNREKRIAMLPSMSGRARADWDPFGELDNRFYAWLEADRHRWDLLADQYATDA